jgi:hypothetical protein
LVQQEQPRLFCFALLKWQVHVTAAHRRNMACLMVVHIQQLPYFAKAMLAAKTLVTTEPVGKF